MTTPQPLKPRQLRQTIDPARLPWRRSDEARAFAGVLGQERAMTAIHTALGIDQEGYNLFVCGPTGVGKHSLVLQHLRERAAAMPRADDWLYVANFRERGRPQVIRLPAGEGRRFREAMGRLLESLAAAIPAAFASEQYQQRVQALRDAEQAKVDKAFEALRQEAAQAGMIAVHEAEQITFVPARDGKPLTDEEYDALSDAEKQRIDETVKTLQGRLQEFLRQRQSWHNAMHDALAELNREVGMFAVAHLFEELRARYRDHADIVQYLQAMEADVIDNLSLFLPDTPGERIDTDAPPFRAYQVNLLVDNAEAEGAPVVHETFPLHQNLVGRVEYQPQMGVLVTDHTLVRPGALHRANGGFLVLDVLKVLQQPNAWESLKRALADRRITIQSLAEIYNLFSTVTLEPEPIPLDVKVILIGERQHYYQLLQADPEFEKLFKIPADFDDAIHQSDEALADYAGLVATLIRRYRLRPFADDAVARVLEYSVRKAEDITRFSLHLQAITDLLREADFWAGEADSDLVRRDAVQRALDEQVARQDRYYRRQLEEYRRGTLLLDTEGEVIAQVNGLFVVEMGQFSFGQPARITATARLGDGDVLDIEREVELGGAIHSKGVYILTAFMAARYARNCPLSLSATLVFEQSYGHVEGDSASVGELCALLSALAEVPVRQSLAVTGSVNQHGQVQPIGGVNEKIEGFFDVCREKGLTGEQGVLIPATNLDNLMLRQDVVDAVAAGRFHVWPIRTIDEAIELLTGQPAGEADAEGRFPPGTVNEKVDTRLRRFAELRHEYGKGEEHDDGKDG